ncbi:MAG TPA: chemotaxis protein CheW [Thermodesulfobacteriaceae bacterium]|nr:chemotaxis protein CheW [Thermodesulfobacteriaceae bacterium]
MQNSAVDIQQDPLLLFQVGKHPWAVELNWVREVVPAKGIGALPNSNPEVAGMMNVRGEVIPVIDGGDILNVSGNGGSGGNRKVLLFTFQEGCLGLLVDSVSRVELTSVRDHSASVADPTTGFCNQRFVSGLAACGDSESVPVLDLSELLNFITAINRANTDQGAEVA